MKHVLITGAGGFACGHLAEGFARLGCAVIVAAQFPWTRVQTATEATTQAVRPPLQPSKLDALAGFHWTESAVGIGDLCAGVRASGTVYIQSDVNRMLEEYRDFWRTVNKSSRQHCTMTP